MAAEREVEAVREVAAERVEGGVSPVVGVSLYPQMRQEVVLSCTLSVLD